MQRNHQAQEKKVNYMKEEVEEWYEKVSDTFTEDEFKEEIDKREEDVNKLFSRSVIARMIAVEEGKRESGVTEIKDAETDASATIEGEIVDLGNTHTFEKSNGEGKVRNVTIDDGTDTIKVVFWDEETERVEEEFELGDMLQVINGYIQDKGYGKQISEGKWGEIKHKKL